MLLGVLMAISNATTMSWTSEPTGQTMETLDTSTAVTFDVPRGESLPSRGSYGVDEEHTSIDAVRASTGEHERLNVIIRSPRSAPGRRPAVVFLHGAGYGTAENSFGDVAHDMASAGFVTAVIDKPVWSTTDLDRDYPASARAYDQTIDLLRGRADVDPDRVGIYATSESTWISAYLLEDDPRIAFQVLLSPMVYSPRQALGFFVSQDFALVGAHTGYQSIVRRVFHVDAHMLGFDNFDIDTLRPSTYSVPTFIAYGTKDVMTAQVEGVEAILHEAHRADNWDVTVRSYPIANHVLRLGDEAESGTPFADDYVDDMIDWAVGTSSGLRQTSERVAGASLYQSIAVPKGLHGNRAGTIYGIVLHAIMAVSLLVTLVVALIALGVRISHAVRHRGTALGYAHGFGGVLLLLAVATLVALGVFAAGIGGVVMGVVHLAWGAAPEDDPGVMWWSWPFVQVICTMVVWAWSRVFARLLEAGWLRGIVAAPPRKGAIRAVLSGAEPVLASTRLGRVLFWTSAFSMFSVLLVFAFWGLFVYW